VAPPESGQRVTAGARTECARCAGPLPQHVRALFCPACGAQQVSTPCAACGETVEPGWSFCVACGTQARPAARSPA
jgi:predicted amidophosphoribosyltransferase